MKRRGFIKVTSGEAMRALFTGPHQAHKLLRPSISAAIIVMLAIGGAVFGWSATAQPIVASCATNDEIPVQTRAGLEQVGLLFVQSLVSGNADAAYAALTSGARQAVPRDTLATLVGQAIKPMAPFSNVRVARVDFLKIMTGPSARVICGSLARPEDWESVAAKPIPEQAHLLFEAETRNNGWTFALWLVPEPDWRIEYFHLTGSSMVGKTAHDIWDLARGEQQLNHNFNAEILYQAALQLLYRGPNFQLGIQEEIKKEASKLQVPIELQGQAPFTWHFGGNTFRILNVGPIGVGGKIYLMINHEISPWDADQEADQQNRALISDFARSIPEYRNVFAGLVVGAIERGGHRGFRTIDENTAQSK